MNHIIRDRLWYLMVLFSIFATIPEIIRFNFWGAVFAEKLSFFPCWQGFYSHHIMRNVMFLKHP